MSVNLIEMAKNYLSPDVVEKLGEATGTDPAQARKTLTAAIPAVLAGVVQHAGSEGGGGLMDLIKQKAFDGSALGNLGSSAGVEGGIGGMLESGKKLLSTLFGGKLDGILNLISSATGTSRAGATGLMAAAAPMVMNLIGKVKSDQGLSAGGVRELLMSQKDSIAKFAPPGLANVMGLASLGNLGGMASQAMDKVTGAAADLKNKASSAAEETYSSASALYGNAARRAQAAVPAASNAARNALLALACLAALVAGLWWWNNSSKPIVEAPPPAPVQVARETTNAPPLQGQPINALIPTTLPSGASLQLEPGSSLARLVEFMKSPLAGLPTQRFALKEVTFKGDEKAPAAESSSTIAQIADVLKAFPAARVGIRSYVAAGADSAARDLSRQRAGQVKAQLVDHGIPADRFEVIGPAVEGMPKGMTEARPTWIELEVEAPKP